MWTLIRFSRRRVPRRRSAAGAVPLWAIISFTPASSARRRQALVCSKIETSLCASSYNKEFSIPTIADHQGACLIARYTRPEMGHIWSDQNRFQTWLDVEVAATET